MMFNSVLALAALALSPSAKAPARFADDLIITRILINAPGGSDDNQGAEFIEIKNVGSTTINLGSTGTNPRNVAIVAIENEAGQHGEVDWVLNPFNGVSLDPGERLIIRDSTGTSSNSGVVERNKLNGGANETAATANDQEIITEFIPGSTSTDFSNSGNVFILVSGYQNNLSIGQLLDNSNANGAHKDNLVLDPFEDNIANNEPWNGTVFDIVEVAPDTTDYAGLDDYAANIGSNHRVVGVSNSDWTPDYIIRLNNSSNDYDEAFQMDLDGSSVWDEEGSQFNLMSQNSFSNLGSIMGTVHYYPLALTSGNFTNQAGWAGFSVLGVTYTVA